MKKKVAIIGGGMLGLSLAYELSHKSFDVTIIEKNSDWGGLASGFQIENTYLEKYYHHWFRSDKHIQALIRELGLEYKLKFLESSMGIFTDGKVYNFSGSIDLLKFKPLNIFDRLRTGVVSFFLQKMPYKKSMETTNAIDWCLKYYGKKPTEVIWEPLLRGKFGKEYKRISMSWLWGRIHDRTSSRSNPLAKEYLGYLDGGFQVLIDALVAKLEGYGVKLINNSDIQEYKRTGEKHSLVINGKSENFDIVVSTLPGPIFNKIFNVGKLQRKKIENIKYLGATCMILELKHSLTPYYWLNVNDPKAPFLAVVEHTNFVDKKEYGDKVIVYIAKYIDVENELFKASEEELFKKYCDYLVKINPEFEPDWVIDRHFYKSGFAQHIVTTGYNIPEYETKINELYFANFTQVFPHDRGTNYAVEQAQTLSKLIIAKHGN